MTETPSVADDDTPPDPQVPVVAPGPALDPMVALTTNLHAAPGVFALLLGSGISLSAGIKTGWGVLVDLVKMRAVTQSGDPGVITPDFNAEAWWEQNVPDTPLGYSTVLEDLGRTPAARQSLLQKYFEPTDEDQEDDRKGPGAAHQAIAQLVKRGSVRVILTTNFDRLLEQALQAEGIDPVVISSPAQIAGMAPLQHEAVTVIKLHGDYKDLGQLNTKAELGTYDPAMNTVLDRILDEYGLIICGWSGDWDPALRDALQRRISRRYPVFWSTVSDALSPTAAPVAAGLGAAIMPGQTADDLFESLVAKVEALDAMADLPPTRQMAVARLTRVLANPTHRVEVDTMVSREVEKVLAFVRDPDQCPTTIDTPQDYRSALDAIAAQADTLLHLVATGIRYDDGTHDKIWLRTITRLMQALPIPYGQTSDHPGRSLRHYPALLTLWVAGVAAIATEREDLLGGLFVKPTWQEHDYVPLSAVVALHPQYVMGDSLKRAFQDVPSYPASRLLRLHGRSPSQAVVPDQKVYERTCDRLEVLASFAAAHLDERPYPWLGNFMAERALPGERLADRVKAEIRQGWPFMAAFDGDMTAALSAAEKARTAIDKSISQSLGI